MEVNLHQNLNQLPILTSCYDCRIVVDYACDITNDDPEHHIDFTALTDRIPVGGDAVFKLTVNSDLNYRYELSFTGLPEGGRIRDRNRG